MARPYGGDMNTDYLSVHAVRPERVRRRREARPVEPERRGREESQKLIEVCLNCTVPEKYMHCDKCMHLQNVRREVRGSLDWFTRFRKWCRECEGERDSLSQLR